MDRREAFGRCRVRFLTEVCELQSELHPSSYGNKISKWLEQPVDVTIKLDVRECFKE